ncbi:MAG: hypothetical protein JW819_14120 [Candidatus Krumholzibacteriota bacterium]|nr:hypothetical protein [Candidatus Krumholzibacteriota bacterium]
MTKTVPNRHVIGLLTAALLALLVASLAGCGKSEIKDPYEKATLAQAISGESKAKLFKYELTEPQIVAVEGRLALLAEEDRLEYLVGDDLSLLTTVDPGFKLGVRREWGMQPEVFLILEHVIDGPDTSFVTSDEPPVFPSYTNAATFDRGPYRDVAGEVGAMAERDRDSFLRALGKQGLKVSMTGTLSRAEVGGAMGYFLDSDLGKYKLEGITPLGTLFLKAVLAAGGTMECFGPMGELNRRSTERETGITGPLTLEYFTFQNYMITNG